MTGQPLGTGHVPLERYPSGTYPLEHLAHQQVLLDYEMPATDDGVAVAFELKKGRFIRISGRSTVVFVAFNLHNPKERFDQARSRNNNRQLNPTQGNWLFTKDNTIMLTIVEDTWKWHHDLQVGLCTRKSLELLFKHESPVTTRGYENTPYPLRWRRREDIPARACRDNLADALNPWSIPARDIPGPFNIFQNMRLDGDTGLLAFDHPDPTEDALITMRSEMDLLVGVAVHWATGARVQVLEGWPAYVVPSSITVSRSGD